MHESPIQRVSIVIPVYRGELTLENLVREIEPLCADTATPRDRAFRVTEVLLVHDCGPDHSDETIEKLCAAFSFVRPVWLSRNYGQHAATLAGMASATGDWIVTIDEDGQQDPALIGKMLDTALDNSLQLVYASPTNPPPHGWLRNSLSRLAKTIASKLIREPGLRQFNSFRVIDGEIARTLAAYCGNGVYLDVGLFWVAGRVGHCPVELRAEMNRPSGYSYLKLIGHFWTLVLTTGTRPLRLITIMGIASIFLAILIAGYALYGKFVAGVAVEGWASILIVVSFFSGATLTALGVIAEYLALALNIVMGKPMYVVGTKPTRRGSTP